MSLIYGTSDFILYNTAKFLLQLHAGHYSPVQQNNCIPEQNSSIYDRIGTLYETEKQGSLFFLKEAQCKF